MTTMPPDKPVSLTIELDAELLNRIQNLVPEVKNWPAVQEFGVEVTWELIARIALSRGLKEMVPTANPESVTSPSPPSSGPEKVSSPEPEPPVTTDAGGLVQVPAGWSLWRESEKIPLPQQEVHDYYIRQGWDRWWGRVDKEVISFYYSRAPELHGVLPYPDKGPQGKSILIQDTPWGPGHIIPHKW